MLEKNYNGKHEIYFVVKTTPIPKNKLIEGVKLSLENTNQILKISSYSMGKLESDSISLGIYSYALEEFGKSMLLTDFLKKVPVNSHLRQILKQHTSYSV